MEKSSPNHTKALTYLLVFILSILFIHVKMYFYRIFSLRSATPHMPSSSTPCRQRWMLVSP